MLLADSIIFAAFNCYGNEFFGRIALEKNAA